MRIVINDWFFDQLATGSGQYLAALAEWLPRVGAAHEWVFIRPAGARSAIHTPHCVYHIARTPFDRHSRHLAKLWFEQVTFPRACRLLGAEVAFVPYWGAPWWSPCPVVVTVHDLIPLLLPAYRGGALQRAYTWLVARSAQRAHAVLTDSEASKADVIEHLGVPPQRVHTVYLAADPRYRPVTDPDVLAHIRARYALPPEPFLLYLGGFDVRKNLTQTIQAFARLVEQRLAEPGSPLLQPRLVIAGKLPEKDTSFAPDPRRLVQRLGLTEHVHFAGWVDENDKPALYSLAAATVFVSQYEGFGLPVLEAMASARQPELPGSHSGANR